MYNTLYGSRHFGSICIAAAAVRCRVGHQQACTIIGLEGKEKAVFDFHDVVLWVEIALPSHALDS